MTIIERIRGERRPVQFGRIAKDLMNRDMNALGRDASGVLDQVKDIRIAAADAIEHFQSLASDAADRAGEAFEHVGDAFDHIGDEAAKATTTPRRTSPRRRRTSPSTPARGSTTSRSASARPCRPTASARSSRTSSAISRPPTRAATTAPTAAAGRAPGPGSSSSARPPGSRPGSPARSCSTRTRARGDARRSARSVRSTTEGVTGQLSRTASMATERARGLAVERGLIKPDGGDDTKRIAASASPLVPVMDIPSSNGYGDTEPVMPLADGAGHRPVVDRARAVRDARRRPHRWRRRPRGRGGRESAGDEASDRRHRHPSIAIAVVRGRRVAARVRGAGERPRGHYLVIGRHT